MVQLWHILCDEPIHTQDNKLDWGGWSFVWWKDTDDELSAAPPTDHWIPHVVCSGPGVQLSADSLTHFFNEFVYMVT